MKIINAWCHLWSTLSSRCHVAWSRSLQLIIPLLMAMNGDRRSKKGPMSKGDAFFLSFFSCTYNAYPFPVFVLWSPTRYYVSREWQFERSHSRAAIFREQRQYLRRFHFFFISISLPSPALIRSHCSRFVHPVLPPSPGRRLNRPYRER